MSARIFPSARIDSSELSIYQEFADRAGTADDEVIFSIEKTKTARPSLTSAAAQTTFQKLYRWLFGQKKSDIVQKFTSALEAKYGKDVANFAFSENEKQQALNTGLSKRVIAKVIKNASLVQSARDDMKAYVDMAEMNIQIVQAVNPEIELTELRQKFQKIKNFADSSLRQFNDIAALQKALQEAITVATASKEIIRQMTENELQLKTRPDRLPDALPKPMQSDGEEHRLSISPNTVGAIIKFDEEDSLTSKSFARFNTLMTEEALQASLSATRLQHKKVMAELTTRLQTNPKALEAQLEKLSAIIIESIDKAASRLAVFSHHFHADPSSYFHLEPDGLVALRSSNHAHEESQTTPQENEKVWYLFCNTLEACYGKPLLQRMIPEESRQELFGSPLTVDSAKELFDGIESALEVDSHFLKDQPLIVDDSYHEALSTHPELLQKTFEAEQKAGAAGTLSIQIARKLFDIGVLSAGYHVGGFIAGGIGTTTAAATGVALPIVPLTFVACALCSFVAGRIVGSRVNKDVGSFAAYRAATYTLGGNATEIATQPLLHSFQDYLTHCFSHIVMGPQGAEIASLGAHTISLLTQFGLEEAGSIVADNVRDACLGSVVNGVDIATLPAAPGELLPSQTADLDTRLLDLAKTMIDTTNQLSVPPQPGWDRVRVHF